jgi:hypothetical protein
VGDWREHDVDDYTKGRVPDNSMMLQIALRAALDKMKNLKAFGYVYCAHAPATRYSHATAGS